MKKLKPILVLVLILGIIRPAIDILFFDNSSFADYITLFCSLIALLLLCIDTKKTRDTGMISETQKPVCVNSNEKSDQGQGGSPVCDTQDDPKS